MQTTKTFDCVEMKRKIQADRAEEYAGLTDQEIAPRIQDALDNSRHPAAEWYRRIVAHQTQTARS